MKFRLLVVAALAILGLAACTPALTSRDSTGAIGGEGRLSFAQSVDIAGAGARLSAIRAQNGLSRPMGHSPRLQAAAQAHADYMARTGNFSHTGEGGSTLRTRVRAAGYNACFMAENIAFGQRSQSELYNAWMNSSGHRRNMLSAQATQYGFARAGTYWVLVLGRTC